MFMYRSISKMNINDGVKAFRQNKNAVLLDVRTKEEYAERHIDGSINLPLQVIESIPSLIDDKYTTLYVYCRSGARSAQAVTILKRLGYSNAIDIGGILSYKEEY